MKQSNELSQRRKSDAQSCVGNMESVSSGQWSDPVELLGASLDCHNTSLSSSLACDLKIYHMFVREIAWD